MRKSKKLLHERMTVSNLHLKSTLHFSKYHLFLSSTKLHGPQLIACIVSFFADFLLLLIFSHLAHVSEAQVEVVHQGGVGGVVPHGQAVAAGHI